MRRHQRLGIMFVALATCASAFGQDAVSPQEAAAVDAAMRSVEQARADYRLAPDDVVDVSVYQDHELNAKARVGADGAITLPLAGEVNVAGETVEEAQKAIAQKLTSYVVHPQVNVTLESYTRRVLFVLGEVQKPGPYPFVAGAKTTVLQAITDAGGFTKAAAPRRTHILRYVGGRAQDLRIDVKSLIRRGARDKDLVLEPNDVVYVPQSFF